ncbi:MAG: type II/IV secretion system ATPase subunit [Candidatus Nanoarchaeia archaeon]|nr:type II/IV secretion system ATPase subunit [Candidatus Nanoarchaeia archaeon]MDD5357692.1 type II/IV secretion system ATPase subunit [Candidatus Nanoarchaeia archaeon]MDD5588611.1 type II/IV secretion system ATPase subunit [Candidatus Nanoarchaeia archaeon]
MMNIESYEKVKIDFHPKIPRLERAADKTKIDVRYPVISPFAFVHIYWDDQIYELVYEIEEPILTEQEKMYREQLTSAIRDLINFEEVIERNEETLLDYIDKRLKILAIEFGFDIPYDSYKKIYYYLCRDFVGINEIEPILRDYYVEDIECNGVNSPIYVIHRLYRSVKTNLLFPSMDRLESLVEKLAQRCGKHISYAEPILDGTLPDGNRVNATYTVDITSRGPTFTIRKFTKTPWTPIQLLSFRTLSPEMLAYIWLLVEYRMNILITGGTASGKTTLLNAAAFFIKPEARVVSIEDTRELNLPRENWLPSVARSSTGNRRENEITLFTLLRNSFRQNPDYVIVGEVRGKEAFVLFQGMASGHSSISTMHSESVDTLMKRLETPPIELSPTLLNMLDCICIMTHAVVNNQETRKLREIIEIVNINSDGTAIVNTPYSWNPSDDKFYFRKNSKIFEKISKRYGISMEEINEEFRKRVEILYQMYKKGISKFEEVQELINRYYKKPGEVLRQLGIQE